MDDVPIESRAHYALRTFASVLALDALIFSLAALICVVFGLGLTMYSFSTTLFILGILIMIFSMYTGVTGGWRGLAGYATSLEVRVPGKYQPSAFSNIALGIAGLIAILASIILPLTF
jgi:hypothetical protein